jgi:TetR/AcrR family transcriptional regulator, transcriptional repressor of bet genes
MARAPIRAMRRLELEKAAYAAVNELGVRGFALEEIARHAGTAKGTIHHYFLSKEDLMEGAARHANREFSQVALSILKAAKSPSGRIWSIISLNLDAEFFQPFLARAYVFVLTNGIRYKGVLRIYEATHARTISNLAFALRQLVKPEDVQPIANTIWTMIEGAWLLQASQDIDIAGPTLRIMADYLKTAVPAFDSSVIQNLDRFPEGSTPSHNRA